TRVIADGPAAKAGLQADDLIVAADAKEVTSYQGLVDALREHKPGDKVKLRMRRGDQVSDVEVTLATRPTTSGPQGQQAPADRPNPAYLGGQRENVQNTQGPDGQEYGGVYKSADGGETWQRVNSLNPRPMYFSQIRVDPSDDRRLYVLGVAMHRSQ